MSAYQVFLAALQLPNFAPWEITNYASRVYEGVENSLPPESVWTNLPPTLWILNMLRDYYDSPLTLTSIYRSPAYNAALPNTATNSQHLRNSACDFQVKGVSPAAIHAKLQSWRGVGMFKGGLGLYSTFNHIDTRGENATW